MNKKPFLAVIAICLFMLIFSVSAFAESETADTASNEASVVSSEVVLEEPENKKLEWAYWLIGGASIAAVVASAVVISRKVK